MDPEGPGDSPLEMATWQPDVDENQDHWLMISFLAFLTYTIGFIWSLYGLIWFNMVQYGLRWFNMV